MAVGDLLSHIPQASFRALLTPTGRIYWGQCILNLDPHAVYRDCGRLRASEGWEAVTHHLHTQKASGQPVPGGVQCLSVPRLPLLSVGTRTLLCHHHTWLTNHYKCQKRRLPRPEKLSASATLPIITWNSHYPCVNTWLRSLNTKTNSFLRVPHLKHSKVNETQADPRNLLSSCLHFLFFWLRAAVTHLYFHYRVIPSRNAVKPFK